MLTVWSFNQFPQEFGFIVREGEEPWRCLKEALEKWGSEAVTEHNWIGYLSGSNVKPVKSFPDDDQGWEDAFVFKEDLERY